jgi:hypothetical protein
VLYFFSEQNVICTVVCIIRRGSIDRRVPVFPLLSFPDCYSYLPEKNVHYCTIFQKDLKITKLNQGISFF